VWERHASKPTILTDHFIEKILRTLGFMVYQSLATKLSPLFFKCEMKIIALPPLGLHLPKQWKMLVTSPPKGN